MARLVPCWGFAVPVALVALIVACGARSPLVCVRTPEVEIVPTLYLVLDASESMARGNRWADARREIADAIARLPSPRLRIGVAILGGSDESCGSTGEILAPDENGRLDAAAAAKAFLGVTATVSPKGGTPMSATLRTITSRLRSERMRHPMHLVLVTDGEPNCGDIRSCNVADCTFNLEAVAPECQPSGPRNCCIDAPSGCVDASGTIDAIAGIARLGVPVVVVGLPGTERFSGLLSSFARAGGTARPGASSAYYAVRSEGTEALTRELGDALTAATHGCDFALGSVIPGDARVVLGGHAVERDAKEGFTAREDLLSLHGAACDERRAGAAVAIAWLEQCPA